MGDVSESEDSSSSDEDIVQARKHIGSADLIEKTLKGLISANQDEGDLGMGRHGATIVLGKNQWCTPPLTEQQQRQTSEWDCDSRGLPDYKQVLAKARAAEKANGRQTSTIHRSHISEDARFFQQYSRQLKECMTKVKHEKDKPNAEQLGILEAVAKRIVVEKEFENEAPFEEEEADDDENQ